MEPKYNPFQPNKLVVPGMFIGRVDEIRQIKKALVQAKHGNPVHLLIQGERGIGKSSLLLFASAEAEALPPQGDSSKKPFLVARADLGAVNSRLHLVRVLAQALRKAAQKSRSGFSNSELFKELGELDLFSTSFGAEGSSEFAYNDALDQLAYMFLKVWEISNTEIDGILVMVDEADHPEVDAGLGATLKYITERLDLQDTRSIAFILAGLPSTLGKLRSSHESSPRIVDVISLDPLEPGERQQVVMKGLAVANQKNGEATTITPQAISLLDELSEGYPHFIQQFAFSAFEQDTDNLIDEVDVTEGAFKKDGGALAKLGEKYFSEMYFDRVTSEDYRKALRTMAQHSDSWVERQTIRKESGLSESQLNNALSALKNRKVILSDDTRRAFYRLPTKSFATWINASVIVQEREGAAGSPLPLESEYTSEGANDKI